MICTVCQKDCETFEDDLRVDIDGPGGIVTVGGVLTLSVCHEAPVEEDRADDGFDWELLRDNSY